MSDISLEGFIQYITSRDRWEQLVKGEIPAENVTEAEYRKLYTTHDHYYHYSDQASTWRAGEARSQLLTAISQAHPDYRHEEAVTEVKHAPAFYVWLSYITTTPSQELFDAAVIIDRNISEVATYLDTVKASACTTQFVESGIGTVPQRVYKNERACRFTTLLLPEKVQAALTEACKLIDDHNITGRLGGCHIGLYEPMCRKAINFRSFVALL